MVVDGIGEIGRIDRTGGKTGLVVLVVSQDCRDRGIKKNLSGCEHRREPTLYGSRHKGCAAMASTLRETGRISAL